MSYLDSTHLTFSGDFIADVSTVNNDPAHYNNDTFKKPSFQNPGMLNIGGSGDGWWNPEGGANFNFQNCKVMQVSVEDGSSTTNDVINGTIVCGANGRNTGKMVDLDPQQQMVSELWGVKLRIVTGKNELLFEGDIKNTCFRDIQTRQHVIPTKNGQPAGATWTSVIENVIWGTLSEFSPFLKELKTKTNLNKLSINMNAYGYYYTHEDGRFSMGRLLGAIGPWYDDEPKTFAACRRLYGTNAVSSQQYKITNTNFLCQNNLLTIDFGSSFPISDALGSIDIQDKIFLAASKIYVNQQSFISKEDCIMIGGIDYKTGSDWLNETSGIVTIILNEEVENQLKNHQLLLLVSANSGGYIIVSREALDGIVVRADNFVNRIDYNQTVNIDFYAYQWGRSLNNVAININLETITLTIPQRSISIPDPLDGSSTICDIPGNNYPIKGITFSSLITTDEKGKAVLYVTGNRIDNPRVYIDGQIYFLDYQIALSNQPDPAIPQSDRISIHLRNYFEIPENPEWSDISQTMIQFSNLYPIMSKYFINLADPLAVISKKELLLFAFSREVSDPIYMPVTRDLSENKKQTILKWLKDHDLNNLGDITPAVEIKQKQINLAVQGVPLTNYQQLLKKAVKLKGGINPSNF